MINVIEVIGKYEGKISIGIHNNWAIFITSENAQKAKQEIDNSEVYITGNIESKSNQYCFSYVLKQKSLQRLNGHDSTHHKPLKNKASQTNIS